MGLGVLRPAHRGALLWLVTWHCHLPLLAAQMTTSGAEDAAALREVNAAADTSACNRIGSSPGGPGPPPPHGRPRPAPHRTKNS